MRGSASRAGVSLQPGARARFGRFVSDFIKADPEKQVEAAEWLLGVGGVKAVRLLADALVRRLGRSDETRVRAAAALAGLGPRAVPAIAVALLRSRSARVLLGLAATLAAGGKALPAGDRAEVRGHLMIASGFAPSSEVASVLFATCLWLRDEPGEDLHAPPPVG